jgi:hypothetical protein
MSEKRLPSEKVRQFLELGGPSAGPVSLNGLQLTLVSGNHGDQVQEYSESQNESTDTEEQNERDGPRPEQAQSLDEQPQNQQYSREL